MSSSSSQPQAVSPEVVQQYNNMQQSYNSLVQRTAEVEMDIAEHKNVEEVLAGLEPDRKCWRMVGDVLVERTVGEVLPAIVSNREMRELTAKKLNEEIDARNKELVAFRQRHGIKTRSELAAEQMKRQQQQQSQGGQQGKQQGVLA